MKKLYVTAYATIHLLSVGCTTGAETSPTDLRPIFEHFIKHGELPQEHPSYPNVDIRTSKIRYPDSDGVDFFQREYTGLLLSSHKKLVAAISLDYFENELHTYIQQHHPDMHKDSRLYLFKALHQLER